jgi:hypothetical protein
MKYKIKFARQILAFTFNTKSHQNVRFQVLTAASMKFRIVFWDVLPCKIIVGRSFQRYILPPSSGMEAARTTETSVDNYFTR